MTDHVLSTDGELSAAAAWGDYDNDGDLDLYVACEYGAANLLYRNDGGDDFTRMTGNPAVLDGGHSLGANWADHDNDGDLDLLVVNWGSQPGRRRGSGWHRRICGLRSLG
jgi:hypothetical protein